jgi:hypothetical protein
VAHTTRFSLCGVTLMFARPRWTFDRYLHQWRIISATERAYAQAQRTFRV